VSELTLTFFCGTGTVLAEGLYSAKNPPAPPPPPLPVLTLALALALACVVFGGALGLKIVWGGGMDDGFCIGGWCSCCDSGITCW
jgi:hypothetical protein